MLLCRSLFVLMSFFFCAVSPSSIYGFTFPNNAFLSTSNINLMLKFIFISMSLLKSHYNFVNILILCLHVLIKADQKCLLLLNWCSRYKCNLNRFKTSFVKLYIICRYSYKTHESHILIDDDSGKILISSEYIPVYI